VSGASYDAWLVPADFAAVRRQPVEIRAPEHFSLTRRRNRMTWSRWLCPVVLGLNQVGALLVLAVDVERIFGRKAVQVFGSPVAIRTPERSDGTGAEYG
jgi:hypothetical protein